MVIDLYLKNAIVYNLQYKLDVLVGEKFTLVMDAPGEMNDVFANNDEVLSHKHHDTDIEIEALTVGVSLIRIMKDSAIIKDILITVVDSIHRPATALGTTFSPAIPK